MKNYSTISEGDLSPTETELILEDRLAESAERISHDEHLALWVAEANRRLEELISGAVQAIPGPEAIASLRRKYGG